MGASAGRALRRRGPRCRRSRAKGGEALIFKAIPRLSQRRCSSSAGSGSASALLAPAGLGSGSPRQTPRPARPHPAPVREYVRSPSLKVKPSASSSGEALLSALLKNLRGGGGRALAQRVGADLAQRHAQQGAGCAELAGRATLQALRCCKVGAGASSSTPFPARAPVERDLALLCANCLREHAPQSQLLQQRRQRECHHSLRAAPGRQERPPGCAQGAHSSIGLSAASDQRQRGHLPVS